MKKLSILLILFIVIVLGAFLVYREGSLPVDKTDKSNKIFVVEKGEGLNSIARRLANDNLIRNRLVFYTIVKQNNFEKTIQAGDFRLSPSMSAYDIAKTLTHGTLDEWVTIPEGLRKEEIAEILTKKFPISTVEFTQLAPEGQLFPDTYLIPTEATAEPIIQLLTNTYNQKYSEELRKRVRRQGLTDEEGLILASLVEKEARNSDRREVASILLKRLKNDWPLQTDAAIQYALGYQVAQKRWWNKQTTFEDLKIKSPYNTYLNKGLPPGPICNPGLDALEAVANADPNIKYWFYLHDTSGKPHFAVTLEEHDANIAKYLK